MILDNWQWDCNVFYFFLSSFVIDVAAVGLVSRIITALPHIWHFIFNHFQNFPKFVVRSDSWLFTKKEMHDFVNSKWLYVWGWFPNKDGNHSRHILLYYDTSEKEKNAVQTRKNYLMRVFQTIAVSELICWISPLMIKVFVLGIALFLAEKEKRTFSNAEKKAKGNRTKWSIHCPIKDVVSRENFIDA